MVFTKALLSPPVWKKQPQAMKPAHTRTKPARGPSARNAQIAPRTAILKERPTTCDMAYPLLDIGYGWCAAEPAPSARLSRQPGRLARTPKYFLSGPADTAKSPEVAGQDYGADGPEKPRIFP